MQMNVLIKVIDRKYLPIRTIKEKSKTHYSINRKYIARLKARLIKNKNCFILKIVNTGSTISVGEALIIN